LSNRYLSFRHVVARQKNAARAEALAAYCIDYAAMILFESYC
jgi:hypothetical protein